MTLGDIIVLAVLGAIIGLIIAGMARDKKRGKSCGCSGCSGCCGSCASACRQRKQ